MSTALNELKEPIALLPDILQILNSVQEDMTLSKILQEGITDSISTPGKTDPGLTREASNEPPAEETHRDSTEEIVEPIPHESPVEPIPTAPVIKMEVDEEPITPVIMSKDTTLVDHLGIPVTGQVLTLENQYVPTLVPEMTIHHQPASLPSTQQKFVFPQ